MGGPPAVVRSGSHAVNRRNGHNRRASTALDALPLPTKAGEAHRTRPHSSSIPSTTLQLRPSSSTYTTLHYQEEEKKKHSSLDVTTTPAAVLGKKLGNMGPNMSSLSSKQTTANNKKRAYVTFLAGDGDYWKGVVGLAKGLRRVRSAYPLVVAVLPDVPGEHRRKLTHQGCIVREIQPIYPPESQTQFAMAYYVINYSKLRIWEFVEYERMVYLDADIQVYANMDELFELEKKDGSFYAVLDCFCEKTWSHTPQYKVGYCQQCPDRVPWPSAADNSGDLGPPPPLYFNAGMFVHEPSLRVARDLLDALAVTPPTPFAEQDFLNAFFRDAFRPLPNTYNLVLAMLWRHPDKVGPLDGLKAVHYCAAGSKPWRFTAEEPHMDRDDVRALVSRWWDVFNDESLDYKGPPLDDGGEVVGEEDEEDEVRRQPLRQALAQAGAVKYFPAPSAA